MQAGYLVSLSWRKVWYTCGRNWRGMFCRPSTFCSEMDISQQEAGLTFILEPQRQVTPRIGPFLGAPLGALQWRNPESRELSWRTDTLHNSESLQVLSLF